MYQCWLKIVIIKPSAGLKHQNQEYDGRMKEARSQEFRGAGARSQVRRKAGV